MNGVTRGSSFSMESPNCGVGARVASRTACMGSGYDDSDTVAGFLNASSSLLVLPAKWGASSRALGVSESLFSSWRSLGSDTSISSSAFIGGELPCFCLGNGSVCGALSSTAGLVGNKLVAGTYVEVGREEKPVYSFLYASIPPSPTGLSMILCGGRWLLCPLLRTGGSAVLLALDGGGGGGAGSQLGLCESVGRLAPTLVLDSFGRPLAASA
mmetsp:Transcript_8323/g.30705  ORF Transcript_8323/g.30705 Transcript_8323/m.30705 type:complete len:213 (-) Transcript_8323:422-1060(-)